MWLFNISWVNRVIMERINYVLIYDLIMLKLELCLEDDG